ncbi:hypothetical protein [Pontibacter litorisediminis]|uniref:hypothetical protein n=1 Tax=Pontibacter litorisediminis TaxID=1846260 RepID=UPI0023EBCCE2|nr:hypothetical protein [Pontibacter litorisediminis]
MANYLLPFLLTLLTVTQCQRDEVPPQETRLGEAFVLEQGEQLKLTSGETILLELKVEEVSDSRCPEDVVCVWYGNAAVKLKVYGSSGRSQSLSFCIGDCKPEPLRNKHTLTAEVNGQEYEITLLDVLPFPNTEQQQDANKQVKLLVKKTD